MVIGCVGGGSNFAGLAFPFLRRRSARRGEDPLHRRRAGGLPDAHPGGLSYDYGDTAGLTPLMPMYTLGHDFVPPGIARRRAALPRRLPIVCGSSTRGWWRRARYRQNGRFEAAVLFARHEGILPAPEPAHAIRAAIEEAEAAREAGEQRVILFNLCGHGHFDLSAYDAYLAGTLEDPEFSESDMDAALARLPETPAIA